MLRSQAHYAGPSTATLVPFDHRVRVLAHDVALFHLAKRRSIQVGACGGFTSRIYSVYHCL